MAPVPPASPADAPAADWFCLGDGEAPPAGCAAETPRPASVPAVPRYESLGLLGHLLLDAGRHEESLEWYGNALRVLRPRHAKDRPFDVARHFLRNSYLGRAKAQDALGRHAESMLDWEEVVALSPEREGPAYRVPLAEALARNGEHLGVFKAVEDQMADHHATRDHFYQLACVCGRAAGRQPEDSPTRDQYARRGVDLLRRAQNVGLFNDPAKAGQLHGDESLASLRSRAEFQKLQREVKARPPRS